MANKSSFKLKGMKKLLSNFNREIRAIKGRTHVGLIEAVIVIQREAEPGTPVDLGNLRSSFFITSWKGRQKDLRPDDFKGDNADEIRSHHQDVINQSVALSRSVSKSFEIIVLFGYSANYAPFVHENAQNFKRPKAKVRWFYAAIQRSKSEALEAIRKNARIK